MPEFKVVIAGVDKVTAMLKNVNDFLLSPKPMQQTCDDIKAGILDKTAKGHDWQGHNFKPYSKAYAKKKGQGRVDLKVTGEMLSEINAIARDHNHGEVSLTGPREQIAGWHNEGGSKTDRPPKREFMNISENAVNMLVKKNFDDPLMVILGRK